MATTGSLRRSGKSTGRHQRTGEPSPSPAPAPTPKKPSKTEETSGQVGETGGNIATGALINEGVSGGGAAAAAPAAPAASAGTSAGTGGGMSIAGNAPAAAAPEVATQGIFAAGGPLATAAAVTGGAVTGGLQASGASKIVQGETPNLPESGALFFVDGGASLAANALGFAGIGGGKSEAQQGRDKARSHFQDVGILDKDFSVTLADGTKFDMGLDGGAKFTSADGTTEISNGYEVDTTNPLSTQATGLVNPLTAILVEGSPELGSNAAGQLTNAVMSNAGGDPEVARANAQAIWQAAGFVDGADENGVFSTGLEKAFSRLDDLLNRGIIDAETHARYRVGAAQAFGNQPLLTPEQIAGVEAAATAPQATGEGVAQGVPPEGTLPIENAPVPGQVSDLPPGHLRNNDRPAAADLQPGQIIINDPAEAAALGVNVGDVVSASSIPGGNTNVGSEVNNPINADRLGTLIRLLQGSQQQLPAAPQPIPEPVVQSSFPSQDNPLLVNPIFSLLGR